eukprot:maker-scaffold1633_size32735-snap-gene-0.8 protein:Tk03291 transcript:maker-scaffold1633_size32735-snap-gene-0.8-mRNA-1 annotation:"retinol dehydrogenase 13-like"
MEIVTIVITVIALLGLLVAGVVVIRFMVQGKTCQSRCRIDDRTVLITGADTSVGIELVRDLCRRGARVIMAVKDMELGQDVAVEVRGETNGEVVVEYCDMTSLKSVRDFTTKILEQESRIHVLINLASVMWCPLQRTPEGFEMHWGFNHLSNFVMTQLLMPLLHRGAPDARIITVSSAWYKRGAIHWDDPNFNARKYNTVEAYSQSKLANVLFTRELARKLDGTGVSTYCVNPGMILTGLGHHIIPGLGCFWLTAALCCWLPWLKTSENAIQSILYCATEASLSEQSGLYYNECAVQLTTEAGSNMDDAYRLWEMSERMAGLTS